MVVAGGDGTLRTYDGATGNALKAAQAGSPVFALAIDGPGKRLASGSADGIVKLWDAADARLLATFWSGEAGWLAFADGFYSASEGLAAKAEWKGNAKAMDAKAVTEMNDPSKVAAACKGGKAP
jgi:WD40 repeat protein